MVDYKLYILRIMNDYGSLEGKILEGRLEGGFYMGVKRSDLTDELWESLEFCVCSIQNPYCVSCDFNIELEKDGEKYTFSRYKILESVDSDDKMYFVVFNEKWEV